jgi:PAS domain S-box-containing protein
MDEAKKWESRFYREREARKEAERLLEEKSQTLYESNLLLEKEIKYSKRELVDTHELLDKYVITSITDHKGKITNVSEAFCELTEYKRDELIGQSHAIVQHKDTDHEMYKELWSTILDGDVWEGDIKNRTKYGKDYWVRATISPNYQDGKIINFVSVMQNITSRKKLEETNEYMILQSRHAAMGEMIAMIAHQWRQPLSTISTIASDIILQQALDELHIDEIKPNMDSIIHHTTHLSRTINDFRNFFMPNKDKEKCSTKEIIDETVSMTEYIMKNSSIDYSVDIQDDIVLHIYKNELIQVLMNIVKNAKDQIDENSTTNNYIKIHGYREDNSYIIEIEDSGGGIDSDILPKIFEPYFSTKSKNGTGLGLYMSKIIVDEHLGGEIKAYNSYNGAIFSIYLPIQ